MSRLRVAESGHTFADNPEGLAEATAHAEAVASEVGRSVDVQRIHGDIDEIIESWSGYQLPDGLAQAQGARPEDFDRASLVRGIAVEMEHTTEPDLALEIAMSHLVEDPDYYTKLARMEAGEGRGRRKYQPGERVYTAAGSGINSGMHGTVIDVRKVPQAVIDEDYLWTRSKHGPLSALTWVRYDNGNIETMFTARLIPEEGDIGASEAFGTQSYLTSADAGPAHPRHAHCAYLGSPDADGKTSYDAEHEHAIIGGVVQPADDGHDHDLMPDVACPRPYSAGEGVEDRSSLTPSQANALDRVLHGERVVVSSADLDAWADAVTDEEPWPLRRLASIPNPDRVGVYDEYIAFLKTGAPGEASEGAQDRYIILVGGGFVGSGGVYDEYPEAYKFRTESEAVAHARKWVGRGKIEVIRDYGLDTETVVWPRGASERGTARLPAGWTLDSAEDFWDSVGGTMRGCMSHMKGRVDDEGAFCGNVKAALIEGGRKRRD